VGLGVHRVADQNTDDHAERIVVPPGLVEVFGLLQQSLDIVNLHRRLRAAVAARQHYRGKIRARGFDHPRVDAFDPRIFPFQLELGVTVVRL
jgi:hypothetical protein